MTASVIVVNWNRASLLEKCLQSLEREPDVDFEIIVVDNGSTDQSLDVVKRFKQRSRIPVEVIENKGNRGFCAANNQGISVSAGEFIALLNNDAEAEPGWLGSMCRELRVRP